LDFNRALATIWPSHPSCSAYHTADYAQHRCRPSAFTRHVTQPRRSDAFQPPETCQCYSVAKLRASDAKSAALPRHLHIKTPSQREPCVGHAAAIFWFVNMSTKMDFQGCRARSHTVTIPTECNEQCNPVGSHAPLPLCLPTCTRVTRPHHVVALPMHVASMHTYTSCIAISCGQIYSS
jgi:hypothetical protein